MGLAGMPVPAVNQGGPGVTASGVFRLLLSQISGIQIKTQFGVHGVQRLPSRDTPQQLLQALRLF
jgi:hypothetical protein